MTLNSWFDFAHHDDIWIEIHDYCQPERSRRLILVNIFLHKTHVILIFKLEKLLH